MRIAQFLFRHLPAIPMNRREVIGTLFVGAFLLHAGVKECLMDFDGASVMPKVFFVFGRVGELTCKIDSLRMGCLLFSE